MSRQPFRYQHQDDGPTVLINYKGNGEDRDNIVVYAHDQSVIEARDNAVIVLQHSVTSDRPLRIVGRHSRLDRPRPGRRSILRRLGRRRRAVRSLPGRSTGPLRHGHRCRPRIALRLADRIRAARQAAHMTQGAVGAKLDPQHTRKNVCKWERGQTEPNLRTVEQLAAHRPLVSMTGSKP